MMLVLGYDDEVLRLDRKEHFKLSEKKCHISIPFFAKTV